MSRFVAWMPDEAAQAGFLALRQELDMVFPDPTGFRWRAAPQIHMTLRFLGRFTEDIDPLLMESLALLAAGTDRIMLRFDRVECWTKALVARPKASARLELLLRKIDAAASAAGYTDHAGAQTPHVTLAYADERLPQPAASSWPLASSLEVEFGHISLVTTVTGGHRTDAWWPLQELPLADPDRLG